MQPSEKQRGFSLVELSIVLVILGLLTGGILTGQSLIRAAELRSVTTDSERITSAYYTFRDKYFAIPGDMRNATDFWPTQCVDNGANTCNGNGDGEVTLVSSTNFPEALRFWQHLALSGLIEGSYTGELTSDSKVVPGMNLLASKLSQAGYMVRGHSAYSTSYPMAIQFGAYDSTFYASGRINAEEAWGMDRKIDDGKPDTGSFMANTGYLQTGCVTTVGVFPTATGEYILDDTAKNCRIWIEIK